MTAIDGLVENINGVKGQYEVAVAQLVSVIDSVETTSDALAEVGADGLAEVVVRVKNALETVSADTAALVTSLENAVKVLDGARY
ncbi:hypothetical protein [Kineosporia babensis]|uniref:Uncharacterized protein n=1 Tax=Kineosporia babensis TaxID=499548 RepID=A0A9X1NJN2_9ACTN|nr:hypothetical protein [Kineosporia babensis]MCD5316297.1 hypothetical protein [Kineosporia babensis]